MQFYIQNLFPVLAGLVLSSCAVTEGIQEPEDGEAERAEMMQRSRDFPDYLSQEVVRGQLEPIEFGDVVWKIPSSQWPRVRAAADYLLESEGRVILAGGAEVTSAEYARQLGQQRALSVKEALIGEGVPAARISTVSFGLDLQGRVRDRVDFGIIPGSGASL